MDLSNEKARNIILELSEKVYTLVAKYHGSTTGEHNDGIIRTPYLEMMFGKEVCQLFAQTKYIFDPLIVLNPGKKVGGTLDDIKRLMSHHRTS
jgi:FAD/FMN-containing dehydrogenase